MKQFYIPTRIIQSERCVEAHGALFREFGKKAIVVTGRSSARICGALADVEDALKSNGQEMVLYDRVMSNPTVDCIYEGAAYAREAGADFVIAIGGGSPMDAGKAIALLAVNDVPKQEIFGGMQGKPALPCVCIPTTAGTGAEVTPNAVLTNDEQQTKTSIASVHMMPKLALLDARYLQKLPHPGMVNTVIDALSHSMEGMLSVRSSKVTEGLALEAIGLIGRRLQRLKEDALSQDDLSNLLLASAIGGMVIANTGTTVVHSMGYSLTYFRHIDHGRANGLLLPAFLKHAEMSHASKVEKMVHACGFADTVQFAAMIDSLLGEREQLSVGEIEKFTQLASGSKNIKNCVVPVTAEQIRKLFQSV